MSTFVHEWGRPHVRVIVPHTEPGAPRAVPIFTARQMCDRCGAVRNPISLVMVSWGRGAWCRDAPPRSDVDWTDELERVRAELRTIRSSGDYVDVYHAGRRTDRPAPRA